MTLECWSEVHPSPGDPSRGLGLYHPLWNPLCPPPGRGHPLRFLDLVREQMEQANGA